MAHPLRVEHYIVYDNTTVLAVAREVCFTPRRDSGDDNGVQKTVKLEVGPT
jgi:hypothetical protein